MLARAQAWLDRAAFSPQSLPDDLVTGLALAPPIIAGCFLFRAPAFTMLAVAAAVGSVAQLLSRWWWREHIPRPQASPLIAAMVGVALVGPAVPLAITASVAVGAVILELLRARLMPAVRAQAGLAAYAAITVITMMRLSAGSVHFVNSATAIYLNPSTGTPFADPIGIWLAYFGGSVPPIDPIRLYVGNVAGPVFATSLLAIAISLAWLWYARRLSLVVVVGVLVGALIPISLYHWDPLFQLDSGPLWFAGALILADRRSLPGSWVARPLLGLAAGLVAVSLRSRGFGIEATLLTVAALQAMFAVIVVVVSLAAAARESLIRRGRIRRRRAQLRVVDGISKAS